MSAITFPDLVERARERTVRGQVTWGKTLGMLFHRMLFFPVVQAAVALVYLLAGAEDPWQASYAWWPLSATVANLVSVYLLRRLAREEGLGLRSIYYGWRRPIWREVLIALGVLILAGPLTQIPQEVLGEWLFNDRMIALKVMIRPLPEWGLYPLMILFPLTIAFAELPTYFGYVMPRLQALTGRSWLAVGLPVLVLAAQHMTLPLVLDGRFILFRLLMFLPFAALVGIAARLRPSLMPYLMIGHALADISAMVVVLLVTQGIL